MRNSVYDSEATQYRVNFACQTMLRQADYTTVNMTRKFHSCLENDDYEEVAAKIYRRALKNPKLMKLLPRFLDMKAVLQSYDKIFPNYGPDTNQPEKISVSWMFDEISSES